MEERLGDILITLYEKAEENRITREAREEAERKKAEEARRREENRQRKEQEIRLVKELVNKAEDYRIAKEIREYIQAMIESENEDITPEWIEWAKKKADWYDPSVATEDEYLGKRQHEKYVGCLKNDTACGDGLFALEEIASLSGLKSDFRGNIYTKRECIILVICSSVL